jgi:hypothetical protein
MAIEEHGDGKQFVRFRVWPRLHRTAAVLLALAGLSAGAALEHARVAAGTIAAGTIVAAIVVLGDVGMTQGRIERALRELGRSR